MQAENRGIAQEWNTITGFKKKKKNHYYPLAASLANNQNRLDFFGITLPEKMQKAVRQVSFVSF